MTLAASGELSIKNAAGTNRNIAQEVDGNNTGDKNLSTLGATAGKSGGGTSMTEFYGYTQVTQLAAPTIGTASQFGSSCSPFQISVDWTSNSGGNEDTFDIQYDIDTGGGFSGTWTDTGSNDTTPPYLHDGVSGSAGTKFKYRVKALGSGSYSDSNWSSQSNVVTTDDPCKEP